jgi:hypothetical protein
MKKSLILFGLIFCLLVNSVNVFAAEITKEETKQNKNETTKITISFKSGTGNYTVNGKVIKAETSVVSKGRVLIPASIVTDALSATLTIDNKKKTAIINYNGVEIKMVDKKAEAIIAGKKTTIDIAPYIKNSSFMVSISFLADTFGADLTNDKGQVTFVKEIANPNSIKDFGTLIKKTTKEKIGDSYYNWSMKLPKDLELGYRNFNGSENEFAAQDESYFVNLYIEDLDKDTSLENAENNLLEYTKDYTLIDYGKKTDDNENKYVEFIYKDDKYTYQFRYYLSSVKSYSFVVGTDNNQDYLDDKYQKILDSFKFNFVKDGSIEDLSDVTKEGYRKYQDTRMKWSINMHPDWKEFKDDKIQNKVVFNGKDDSYFSVEVYSMNSGETLDSITKDEIIQNETDLNPNLYKLIKQEDGVINGIKCKKFYYTLKVLNKTYYDWVVCFADSNYKYILNVELSDTNYNDSSQRALVEGMINSFTFKELNSKTIGKLLDPDKIVLSDKTRNISESAYSMDIPFNWSEREGSDSDIKSYGKGELNVNVGSYDDVTSMSDFINFLDGHYKDKTNDKFRVESKTTISDKGTVCYKYVLIYEYEDSEYREDMYFIQKGNTVYSVDFMTNNLFYCDKNVKIFNAIWNSFKFK